MRREAIERELQLKVAQVVVAQSLAVDHEVPVVLQTIRLLLRELAMHSNAQIVNWSVSRRSTAACAMASPSTTMPTTRVPMFKTITTVKLS